MLHRLSKLITIYVGTTVLCTSSVASAQTYVNRGDFMKDVVELNGGVLGSHTEQHFSDLPTSSEFYGYFEEAGNEGWLPAKSDCFSNSNCKAYPYETITRGEAVDVFVRAFGLIRRNEAPSFDDVNSSTSYGDSVQTGADYCIFVASDSNNAYHNKALTDTDLVYMISRVDSESKYSEGCYSEGDSGSSSPACGNSAIDQREECDSAELNGEGFCTEGCRFDWSNNSVPVKCILSGGDTAESDYSCMASFGEKVGHCTISEGDTECVSTLSLPPNDNALHYKNNLSGSLGDFKLKENGYNSAYYFVSFAQPGQKDSSAEEGWCTDTDGGKDYHKKGVTTHLHDNEEYTGIDTCMTEDRLAEQYCDGAKKKSELYICPNGCLSGACINKLQESDMPPVGYEDEVLANIEAFPNPFPDTSINALSGKAAAELYRRSVIGGYPDGEFKGSRLVNRAEAAKFLLLARLDSVSPISNNGQFPDVANDQWYTSFVVTAANRGIINGYPDGMFRPANTVNTAEFLKMLVLTFDLEYNLPFSYSDVPSDAWFALYAGVAQEYDLFPARTQSLRPDSAMSREEVAIAIYQYLRQK
jgi:hypothetical protein